MVADGSEKTHIMLFGWRLATPSGKRLAKSAGPCAGKGSLLRAEGAGMLLISLYIGLLFKFMKRKEVRVICASDNAELIRTQTCL